jgi:hypothetical protein
MTDIAGRTTDSSVTRPGVLLLLAVPPPYRRSMVQRGEMVTANDTPGVWRVAATRRTPHGIALLLLPRDADAFLYLSTTVEPGIPVLLRFEEDVRPVPLAEAAQE